MGVADGDCGVHRPSGPDGTPGGRTVAGRPPRRPGDAGGLRRPDVAAGRHRRRPRRRTGAGGTRPVRRRVAVPGQAARRRRAAVAAGAPECPAGGGRLCPRGPDRGAGQLPGAQLPRPQPQARVAGGPRRFRGPGGFPSRRTIGRADASARGARTRALHRAARRAARCRRAACAVHHLDHRPATRRRRPHRRGPGRGGVLRAFRGSGVRRRDPDRPGTRRAVSR